MYLFAKRDTAPKAVVYAPKPVVNAPKPGTLQLNPYYVSPVQTAPAVQTASAVQSVSAVQSMPVGAVAATIVDPSKMTRDEYWAWIEMKDPEWKHKLYTYTWPSFDPTSTDPAMVAWTRKANALRDYPKTFLSRKENHRYVGPSTDMLDFAKDEQTCMMISMLATSTYDPENTDPHAFNFDSAGYTWNKEKGKCELTAKKDVVGLAYEQGSVAAQSINMFRHNRTLLPNTDLSADKYGIYKDGRTWISRSSDATECASTCFMMNPACHSYTYDPAKESCLMFSQSLQQGKTAPGVTSGVFSY
jgi:hypothetical protein